MVPETVPARVIDGFASCNAAVPMLVILPPTDAAVTSEPAADAAPASAAPAPAPAPAAAAPAPPAAATPPANAPAANVAAAM